MANKKGKGEIVDLPFFMLSEIENGNYRSGNHILFISPERFLNQVGYLQSDRKRTILWIQI